MTTCGNMCALNKYMATCREFVARRRPRQRRRPASLCHSSVAITSSTIIHHIYIYIYIYISLSIHICKYIYIYISLYINNNIYIYIYIYIRFLVAGIRRYRDPGVWNHSIVKRNHDIQIRIAGDRGKENDLPHCGTLRVTNILYYTYTYIYIYIYTYTYICFRVQPTIIEYNILLDYTMLCSTTTTEAMKTTCLIVALFGAFGAARAPGDKNIDVKISWVGLNGDDV